MHFLFSVCFIREKCVVLVVVRTVAKEVRAGEQQWNSTRVPEAADLDHFTVRWNKLVFAHYNKL